MRKLLLALVVLATAKFWWFVFRYRNSYVRLSVSYLLRIKVDDLYLLVKNARGLYYQPVGGVFKRYRSSDCFFRKIRALSDNLLPLHQVGDTDLRIRVPGKYIARFVQWFAFGKEREMTVWREFYEEVIQPGYVPHDLFSSIRYRYIRRHTHTEENAAYTQSPELLIADVYELIPTQEQREILRQRRREDRDRYIWVSEETIRRCGFVGREEDRSGISLHSQWIL